MAYQIKVSKDAEKDILTAKCHYRITALERAFDINFRNQIDYLKANPYLFHIYYRNVRRVHFSNFKYSLDFLIQNDTISILRALHHKQSSNKGLILN